MKCTGVKKQSVLGLRTVDFELSHPLMWSLIFGDIAILLSNVTIPGFSPSGLPFQPNHHHCIKHTQEITILKMNKKND